MTISRVLCCQFCNKTFVRKVSFDKHKCIQKKKFEDTHDISHMDAHKLFVYWLTINNMIRRNKEPDLQKFLQSPLRNSFIKVVAFVREHGLTSSFDYIRWLSKNNIPERYWSEPKPGQLDQFKVDTNLHEDPIDQASMTKREVEKWLMEHPDNTVDDYFNKLSPITVLNLMKLRQITPWVAFGYDKVADKWLTGAYNRDVYYKINELVNCDYWIDKVVTDSNGADKVNIIMDSLWA